MRMNQRALSLADLWSLEIRRGDWGKAVPFPSIRSLARRWNASKATVSHALSLLRRQGLIEMGLPQRGFRLPGQGSPGMGPDPVPLASGARESRAASIAQTLRNEILSGQAPPGTILPTLKELRRRFRCSHPS